MTNKHLGGNFDDFLQQEGLLAEVEAAAIKRMIAYQIIELMKQHNLSKTAMAKRMQTVALLLTGCWILKTNLLPFKPWNVPHSFWVNGFK